MSDNRSEQGAGETLDVAAVQLIFREARDLIRALEGTTASRVKIQTGTLYVEVERGDSVVVGSALAPAPSSPTGLARTPLGVLPIVAPLVGVFYRAPSAGAPAFVEVGDTVERGQQVGIVEAMKVMNEVISDHHGVVIAILVENGEAVQYEQPLILLDTTGSGPT